MEKLKGLDSNGASVLRGSGMREKLKTNGIYTAKCYDKNGNLIDLIGATVTIEYKDPAGKKEKDIAPDTVDTDTSTVTWLMSKDITINGA